jgi:hypothetical protein
MSHATRSILFALIATLVSPRFTPAQDAPPAATAPVTFLTLERARAAVIDDSADPYFDKLTALEMSAKTGRPITGDTPEAQRAECKARYQAACEDFTDAERQALTTLLTRIHPGIDRTYPGFAKQPWSFIKVKATLEGGMPHTRGPHVIVSPPVLGAMRQMALGGDAGTSAAAGILAHEQTHVLQRLHPEWFTKLYTDVMGFQRVERVEPHPWVAARQLVNPDGIDTRWVFPVRSDSQPNVKPRWIWPLVIFSDTDATSLRQMTFIALDLEPTDSNAAEPESFKVKSDVSDEPVREPLAGVGAYVRAVRTRHSLYHPNEAAADLMARLVIAEALGQGAVTDAKDMEPVRAWAKETFGPGGEREAKP